MVREIWFEKSGSRNLVREKWLTRKKGGFIPYIQIFSGSRKVVDQKKISEFEEPLLYTFLENRLQNKWSSGAPTLPHGERTSSKVVGMMFPLVEIGLRPGFPGFF